jgi:hypothetical protein
MFIYVQSGGEVTHLRINTINDGNKLSERAETEFERNPKWR